MLLKLIRMTQGKRVKLLGPNFDINFGGLDREKSGTNNTHYKKRGKVVLKICGSVILNATVVSTGPRC